MNIFVIDRLPDPDQLRGSGTFLFAGVWSKYAIMWRIVPFGNSGA
jgi:hypothetical protein